MRPLVVVIERLPTAAEADMDASVAELRNAHAVIEATRTAAEKGYEALYATLDEEPLPMLAVGFLEAGLPFDTSQFGSRDNSPQAAREILAALADWLLGADTTGAAERIEARVARLVLAVEAVASRNQQ